MKAGICKSLREYQEFIQKTSEAYEQCLICANEYKNHPEKSLIELEFKVFKECNDVRMFEFYAIDIHNYLMEVESIVNSYYMDYNEKKIIIYRRINNMNQKFTIEIPYGSRSQYFDFVVKVNDLTDADGYIVLWVNNNPYSLKSYLLVETQSNGDKIECLIKEYGLKNDTSKGLEEFLLEMGNRMWNFRTIPLGKKGVESAYLLYEFAEEEDLEKKGYRNEELKRKKVFLSYCHADKDIVLDIVDKMKKSGLYLWIDEQEIDAGDSILQKVMSGIDESDLCVTFISEETIKAQFARHELSTIWHKVIYNQKKWFIVKLDDVDIEKVYSGLGQYLYYEVKNMDMAEAFIKALERKISRLQ